MLITLKALESVDVSGISLEVVSEEEQDIVPTILQNLPNLRSLRMSRCFVFGDLVLPQLGAFEKLQVLDLSQNAFSGMLPSFTSFPKLEVLNIEKNYFRGELDIDVQHLPALRELRIAQNQFDGGVVPAAFADLDVCRCLLGFDCGVFSCGKFTII